MKSFKLGKRVLSEGPDNNAEEMQRSREQKIKTGKLALK